VCEDRTEETVGDVVDEVIGSTFRWLQKESPTPSATTHPSAIRGRGRRLWAEAASPILSSGLRRKGARPLDDRPLTDEAGAATAETVSIWVVAAEAEGAASGRRAASGREAEVGVGAVSERGLDSGATGLSVVDGGRGGSVCE